ncbi:MAG: hypothetical protein RLZZ502_1392 [Pseudomonadota bacterium]
MLELLKKILKRFVDAEAMVYAGYLSFLSLLGLVPLLAILFWLSLQADWFKDAETAMRDFVLHNLFPQSAKQVTSALEKLRANAGRLGNWGIFFLALDLLLKAQALALAFERVRSPKQVPQAWRSLLRALPILLLLVPAGVVLASWSVQAIAWCLGWLHPLSAVFKVFFFWASIVLPLWVGIFLILHFLLPKQNLKPNKWRHSMWVALGITVAIELNRYWVLERLVYHHSLKSLYGSFASFPLVLLIIYLAWTWLLLGACVLCELRGPKVKSQAS